MKSGERRRKRRRERREGGREREEEENEEGAEEEEEEGTERQSGLQALNVFYLVFCRERLLTLVGLGPILHTFRKSYSKPFWCTSM